MNILHLIPYFGRNQGGPVESLRLLANAQARLGHTVRIIHTGRASDGEPANVHGSVKVFSGRSFGPNRWAPNLKATARWLGSPPDVIHSHGLWLDIARQASGMAKNYQIPHLVSPCGMLQPAALDVSRAKKRIAWVFFQKKVLRSAVAIHAKSATEQKNIQSLFPEAFIPVIPNPMAPPAPSSPFPSSEVQIDGFHIFGPEVNASKNVALFLGRLHPVKGLQRLIQSWVPLHTLFPDWRLALVGPDEDGYQAKLKILVKQFGLEKSVLFPGPLFGPEKWTAYRAADLFVLPSDFENFGQSVAEALWCRLPVITTTGTPWRELREKRCGWWVEPSVPALSAALKEAMSLDDSQRKKMGERGKQIVDRFQPSVVAGKMVSLYKRLSCFGPRYPT